MMTSRDGNPVSGLADIIPRPWVAQPPNSSNDSVTVTASVRRATNRVIAVHFAFRRSIPQFAHNHCYKNVLRILYVC